MAAESDASSLPSCLNGIGDSANLSERFQVSDSRNKSSFSITPVLVDFSRLLLHEQKSKHASSDASCSVVSGMTNSDLLHAIVGLYDVCLSELTPDVLYSTVCAKWARTLILVRDVKDVFLEFEKRRDKKEKKDSVPSVADVTDEDDVYHCPDPLSSTFSHCYSDSESEEEDDSDDEEDYSKGINKYISQAVVRRQKREKHTGPFSPSHIGPENRIIAACTFDKKYIKSGEKIVHLTLLTIRKRFRGLGLGKYLMSQVKDPTVSGVHDAVVVHAESEAASFFVRCGFTDDLLLNSKWKEIAEQFTNCMLLTYIPPYTGQSISNKVADFDLLSLDHELRKWKDKSLEAYQSQVTIIERMKAEMIRLRSMISTQDDIISSLKSKLTAMEANQIQTEKELMFYKNKRVNSTSDGNEDRLDGMTSPYSMQQRYQIVSSRLPDVDTELISQPTSLPASSSAALLATDEQELKRYVVVPNSSGEIYDHGKDITQFHRICEDFKTSLRRDSSTQEECTVTSVSKALLTSPVINRYAMMMRSIGESSMVMKLYYCGSSQHPERLEHILKDGFSEQDVANGEYGRGLYFSKNAFNAVHFSPPHKVLVAEVIVGKCQAVVTKDKGRQSPDKGFDSIICPGRLSAANSDSSLMQEFVIFDCSQTLPLDLIEYTTRVGNGDKKCS